MLKFLNKNKFAYGNKTMRQLVGSKKKIHYNKVNKDAAHTFKVLQTKMGKQSLTFVVLSAEHGNTQKVTHVCY